MASCSQIESLLQAYTDGELNVADRKALEAHFEQCPGCERLIQQHERANGLLVDVFSEHRLQRDLRATVMAHLPEADFHHTPATATPSVQRIGRRPVPVLLRLFPVMAPLILVLLALAIFFAWPSMNNNAETAIGMVTGRSGAVTRNVPESTERVRVALMELIQRGHHFETPMASHLQVSLAGPTDVRIAQNGRVKILDDRKIRVERGKVWLNVSKAPRTFRVATPTGEITVWGTTFSVEVSRLGTLVIVEEGEVTVEYGSAFAVLRENTQLMIEPNATQLLPSPVAARQALAWHDDVGPDEKALQVFNDLIKPRDGRIIRAEQYFVLDVRRNPVHAIIFRWQPDVMTSDHAGYDVYFYDDFMEPLMIKHIEGKLFNAKSRNSVELSFPDQEALREVNVLHLKVVPDTSQGSLETTFTEVFWVPAND